MNKQTENHNQPEVSIKFHLDKFTPDILGAIWITEGELEPELKGELETEFQKDLSHFNLFDYLFDGLISQYIHKTKDDNENSKKTERKLNLFFTKNFNKKVFLAHMALPKSTNILFEELIKQLNLITQNMNEERNKILIFNQLKSNLKIKEELEKSFPQFIFLQEIKN